MGFPVVHEEEHHRFVSTIDGRECLLQYRLAGAVMQIVHTEVPPELEGQGIAGDLMRAALDAARSKGWRVQPRCSYARRFLERHREYDDLIVD